MPEKRIIQVPGDKPREVWLHRAMFGVSPWHAFLYGTTYSADAEPQTWHRSEESALDFLVDQIREEIAMQKLDDYNDKREADSHA